MTQSHHLNKNKKIKIKKNSHLLQPKSSPSPLPNIPIPVIIRESQLFQSFLATIKGGDFLYQPYFGIHHPPPRSLQECPPLRQKWWLAPMNRERNEHRRHHIANREHNEHLASNSSHSPKI